MIEMPAKLNERWGHVWAQARPHCFMDRPWWDSRAKRRCDGVTIEGLFTLSGKAAAIDRERPLPAPYPMPGQVWAFPDGEAQVVAIERSLSYPIGGRPENATLRTHVTWSAVLSRLNPQWHITEAERQESQWPVRGAILVAGPSQYGRDIPWCPVEEG